MAIDNETYHSSNQGSDDSMNIEQLLTRAVKNVVDEEKKNDAFKTNRSDGPMPQTIDLKELFIYLLGKFKLIIILAVIGAVIGGLYARFYTTPIYSATSKLYVISRDDSKSTSTSVSDLQVGSQLSVDYTEVFKTWEVHEAVREKLGLDYSDAKLQSKLTIAIPSNTRVIYITVRDTDPQMAAALANAYVEAAKEFIESKMETATPSIFSTAKVPELPISSGPLHYVLMGLMAGFFLAVCIAIVMFVLDDRPKSPEDVTKYSGVPTLGVVPLMTKKRAARNERREG